LVFALASTGNSMLARIAMMAITTRSSIKVNATDRRPGWGGLVFTASLDTRPTNQSQYAGIMSVKSCAFRPRRPYRQQLTPRFRRLHRAVSAASTGDTAAARPIRPTLTLARSASIPAPFILPGISQLLPRPHRAQCGTIRGFPESGLGHP